MSDDPRDRAEQRTLLMPRREVGSNLPRGYALDEFVVERVLGVGGNSIVYLAQDTKLDRRVAVKEFLPGTIAARIPNGEVAPRLPRFAQAYDKGLQSFMNEARMLGSFDHLAVVKVYRFWAANGTAYMAMPYYDGITLKKWLADLGAPPSEKWLRQLAGSLVQGLDVLHAHGCVHRDVAPDNILMQFDKSHGNYLEQAPRPVLLDFGSARRVVADATQNLTSLLKSGYSPIEQYDNDAGLEQGPWTDVYALSAVLYTAAMGRAPNAAIARVVRDDMVPARVAAKGRYSQALLAAIDAGLTVRPEQRPQSMKALAEWISRPEPPPTAEPAPQPAAKPAGKTQRAAPAADLDLDLGGSKTPSRHKIWWMAGVSALVLLAALTLMVLLS